MVNFNALALTAALTGLSQAVGRSKITNNCDDSVYLWVVGSSQEGPTEIKSGDAWAEDYWRDDVSGGVALKIARTDDGVPAGEAHTIFGYTLDEDRIWYDLYDVFGNPFAGEEVVLAGEGDECPDIEWPEGVAPGGVKMMAKTVDCAPENDTNLYLCGKK
ncbi:hypothetical protein LIA77_09137 [Sarocladium implicatum]|nr:hypothetical protein LIA77_09137 [Sarocladium implicatum]